jgi:hypothetical protein
MTHADFARWAELPDGAAGLLREWDLHPLVVGGQERGGAITRGTEIHFAVAPQWRHRAIARQRARDFLAPLIERMGFLTTRATPGDGHHRFLTRMGFSLTWQEPGADHYMLCSLPFGGKEN